MSINKNNIQKAVAVTVVALITIGALVAVTKHYQEYQSKETQRAQAAEQVKTDEVAKLKNEQTELVSRYNVLRIECEKGREAYDLLTPFSRTKATLPNCGAVLIR